MKINSYNISVIIPVYNSEASLSELCGRLNTVLAEITDKYEIILVNDDSQDSSGDVISQLSKKNERINGIHLMKNYGQHNALLCGIRDAKYELVVTLDDDLQNPPEEIPKMLDKLGQGYDVVYGLPEKEQHGLFRDLASKISKITLKTVMGAESASHVSTFRIFYTQLREAFKHYSGSFVSIDVLLTWGTDRFASTPVKHNPRERGKSNYTLRKLIVHALNMITGFSILPLKIASMIGFVFAFFGFCILVFVIVQYFLIGTPVQGFPFLASIVAIFSGVQLLAIGIIGEYLARMYFRSMEKPVYAIRKLKNL